MQRSSPRLWAIVTKSTGYVCTNYSPSDSVNHPARLMMYRSRKEAREAYSRIVSEDKSKWWVIALYRYVKAVR